MSGEIREFLARRAAEGPLPRGDLMSAIRVIAESRHQVVAAMAADDTGDPTLKSARETLLGKLYKASASLGHMLHLLDELEIVEAKARRELGLDPPTEQSQKEP